MSRTSKIWSGFLLLTAVVILSQCSPRVGRSLLTFLFDGVPVADSTVLTVADSSTVRADTAMIVDQEGQAAVLMVIHYPYGERECSACHDPNSLGTMVEPEPGLCYICHEDLGTVYNYLHGPVAGGYCTSCHHPHQAEAENLLRYTGQELCFHCHDEASVGRNEMHQDLGDMSCMECHNPHGGEDKYIFY